jgi:hypothetical protein
MMGAVYALAWGGKTKKAEALVWASLCCSMKPADAV